MQDQLAHDVHTLVVLLFLVLLLRDNMYLIFLFLWYAYCKFVFLLLTWETFPIVYSSSLRITIALSASAYPISIRMCTYITVTITKTIFTFTHFSFPQFRRSTYQYLPFSIYYYLLHSILKFVPSNQKEFHLSLWKMKYLLIGRYKLPSGM